MSKFDKKSWFSLETIIGYKQLGINKYIIFIQYNEIKLNFNI